MPVQRRRAPRARRLAAALVLLAALLAALPAPAARAAPCEVTSTADSGTGTLRARLLDAGCDAITFRAGLPSPITLAGTLPTITRALTIAGPGVASLTIQGNNTFPLLVVDAPGLSIAISGLTLKRGHAVSNAYGGNLRVVRANLALTDVALTAGTAAAAGQGGAGAYLSGGTSTLTRVEVSGNIAHTGAGLFIDEFFGDSDVTIADSDIFGNVATNSVGGGLAVIRDSGVNPPRTLRVALAAGTEVLLNTANADGGGGIYSSEATLGLTGSAVSFNRARDGGGLRAYGGATTIVDSTFNRNGTEYFGGGIAVSAFGTATLTNSTVSGNSAGDGGGGLMLYSGTATLTFVTLTGNTADNDGNGTGDGGGLYVLPGSGGRVDLRGSLVAGNADRGGQTNDCSTAALSQGKNLIVAGGGCPAQSTDLLLPAGTPITWILDPELRRNGGPTATHALATNSPAMDAIPANACLDLAGVAITRDQRGERRPQGPGCDVGAYEVTGATALAVASASGPYGGTTSLSATLRYVATGTPLPGRTVAFTLNGTPVGAAVTTTTGIATLAGVSLGGVAAGDYPAGVGAAFAGEAAYPASAGTAALTVARADQTIAFAPLPDRTLGDQPFALGTTASSGLPVAYVASGGCAVAGATVTLVAAGTCTITAAQGGDGNYNSAPNVARTFAIAPSPAPTPAPSPCGTRFGDVPAADPACVAIEALSARGIINGCDAQATPPLFCPADITLRHQMAALIVRAMPGWQGESWPNSFTDPTEDVELWSRVATLQHYGVVGGYTAESCVAQGKAPPCYGPLDPVLKAQAISFVTRAMVAKGYWVQQPTDPTLYGGALVGTGHEQDATTYWHYTRARGGVPDHPEGGAFLLDQAAPRGWFARLLWAAIQGTPAAP